MTEAAESFSGSNYVAGKVVVVTGAGSGFGRLTAKSAASMGASIVAADIDPASLKVTVAAIVEAGGSAIGVETDVASKQQMDAMARAAVDTYGTIDVLVNNAGVMPLAFFADHQEAWSAWERCIDINFKGVMNGVIAVYDQMMSQGRGHIINLSSIYANQGTAGSAVYSATKAAVVVLSDALRVEAQGKIKVTVIRPTGVPATNLTSGIINLEALIGLTGQNVQRFGDNITKWMDGSLHSEQVDRNSVRYWTLAPEDLTAQIIAVMNMPWGVNISDVTVRATGEDYIN
jgi:NADP-dependent 3-hydroxy acid dehydrogenase YdfG